MNRIHLCRFHGNGKVYPSYVAFWMLGSSLIVNHQPNRMHGTTPINKHIHIISLPPVLLSITIITKTAMRITILQSLLLSIAVLSAAAARSAKYQNSETDPSIESQQRLRQINLNVVQTSSSGKPRRQAYVRREQDRHSKATSQDVAASMSMSNDDGYGPATAEPTPSPIMFEETPAPVVEEINEETGEVEDMNFGPIDVNVDVGMCRFFALQLE